MCVYVYRYQWLCVLRAGNGGVAPVLGLEHKDIHKLEGLDQTHFIEECRVTGSNQTLYWYKDGVDITQYYDVNTGILVYNQTIDPNVHGVYQCFVENEAGSDYVNFRALPRCECYNHYHHHYLIMIPSQTLLTHLVTSVV